MKYTIQDLREGKVAIDYKGNLEKFEKVLKEAFPDDECIPLGTDNYYCRLGSLWLSFKDYNIGLPLQSEEDFKLMEESKILSLEKGKYYTVIDGEHEWIFKSNSDVKIGSTTYIMKGEGNFISNTNEKLYVNSQLLVYCVYGRNNRTFRSSTQEEIDWLDRCIKENKFVDKKPLKFTKEQWLNEEVALEWEFEYKDQINNFLQECSSDNTIVNGYTKYYHCKKKNKGLYSSSNFTSLPVVSIINLIKEDMKTITFTPYQQKATIEMACPRWQDILAKEFGYTIALNKDLEITEERFKEFLIASNTRQLNLFKKMFPDYFNPKHDIKKGQLIYLKSGDTWVMRYFSHWDGDEVACYMNQEKEGATYSWNEYSITNPLEKN